MNIQRGDVVKARFPHASGERGKKRPVVVVQADSYNRRLRHAVVAETTGNLEGKGDLAQMHVSTRTRSAIVVVVRFDVEFRLAQFGVVQIAPGMFIVIHGHSGQLN